MGQRSAHLAIVWSISRHARERIGGLQFCGVRTSRARPLFPARFVRLIRFVFRVLARVFDAIFFTSLASVVLDKASRGVPRFGGPFSFVEASVCIVDAKC